MDGALVSEKLFSCSLGGKVCGWDTPAPENSGSVKLEHLEKKIVYTHHDVRHGVRGKAAARPTCGAAAGKVQLNCKYPLSSIS